MGISANVHLDITGKAGDEQSWMPFNCLLTEDKLRNRVVHDCWAEQGSTGRERGWEKGGKGGGGGRVGRGEEDF